MAGLGFLSEANIGRSFGARCAREDSSVRLVSSEQRQGGKYGLMYEIANANLGASEAQQGQNVKPWTNKKTHSAHSDSTTPSLNASK